MKQKFKILLFFLLLGVQTYAQSLKITGTVTDDKGLTLPGATVVIVGKAQGVVTDIEGKYTLMTTPGSQIKFSFIGFDDQIRTVENKSVINVQMFTSTQLIADVVVVGYGTQQKANVVSALEQTTSAELKKQGNVTNMTDALTGSLPGVTVLTQTGMPGGSDPANGNASNILIRGKNTWNDAGPLILVDGIERKMNDVDVNEVSTVTVLKDASATAVFGMKGGNGVILITTKRGVSGKPKLSFEVNKTFETLSKYSKVVDSYTALQAYNYALINEVDVNSAGWGDFTKDHILDHYKKQDLPFAFPNTDNRELLLRDFGSSEKYNMSISGGTNFVKYFGSLTYLHEGDVMNTQDIGRGYNPEFGYDRFNIRTNYDFTISKTTTLAVNIAGMYGRQKKSAAGILKLYNSIYNYMPSNLVPRYEDGVFGQQLKVYGSEYSNEFENLNSSGVDVNNRIEINNDFTLDQKLNFITKGLSLKGKLAYDSYFATRGPRIEDKGYSTKRVSSEFYLNGGYYNYDAKQYEIDGVAVDMTPYTTLIKPDDAETNVFIATSLLPTYKSEEVQPKESKYNLVYEASLNYARTFNRHTVTGLALFTRQQSEVGSNWPKKREDWVGRITYDYNSKYFADVNGAYNGSEAFGPGYKFDFFPSVALGWNIANEMFVKQNAPFIDNFKLRYSYGIVGNDRVGSSNWAYLTIWEKGSLLEDNGNFKGFGLNRTYNYELYKEGTPGVPDLHWEKARKQNIGLDFGFLDNMISGTVDLFNEHRYDMLLSSKERNLPNIYGQNPSPGNIGKLEAKGMELQLNIAKAYRNTFEFAVGASWTITTNEIIYKEDPVLRPDYLKEAGYPIGQTRVTQQIELMKSWDDVYNYPISNTSNTTRLPGDFAMMDFNSNARIDVEDSAPYGFPIIPRRTYTFNFNVGYKGVKLDAVLYGTQNVTRNSGLNAINNTWPSIHQQYIDATSTPQYGNTNPTYPQLNVRRSGSGSGTFDWIDGSILRLRSVQLSYDLPKNWTQPLNISNFKIYVNGNNLFIWTKMPNDGEGVSTGDANKNYPIKRVVTLGANIQF